MRGEYISHPLINILIIQTDMLEMICTQKRSEELLHGKQYSFFFLKMFLFYKLNTKKQRENTIFMELFFYLLRCDRILWYGRGLNQLSYVRGESKFSDHRPVYGVFLAEVEAVNRGRIRKSMSCSSSRIEVEELLPYPHRYTEFNFY